ncbi:serine/threonine-protein phosphatase 2A regulatory subunit B'' subunit gamma-like [Bacillus rossius redtenbacheri]|uniref:serine/threonine-protein phosphatase 2A regulatory subunit B'' subunit gamma-like n=1 Tax=Bacillus rossius redtenbacheri TaxID=93214 RepID=UPI002FDE1D9D
MDLKKLFEKYASSPPKVDPAENRKVESELFTKYYTEWKGSRNEPTGEAYKIIPKFYHKLPKESEVLSLKLREEARAIFLQRRGKELLSNDELKALWTLLEKHNSPPHSDDDKLIDYDDFLRVASLGGPKYKPYFTPVVFANLQHGDPYGRISIMTLFSYVMKKVWYHQTRIGLSLYDVVGQGYVRESDLESYILELIPTLPQLDGLEKSFHSFYVCTAVRKFFFFLDPLRTGRVRIQDILACSFLDELLELRDLDSQKDLRDSNWFSAPSALRVYGQYLNLDKDHNGMLNKEELAGYGTGTLTRIFMDRVFQECLTYDGEMDYKTYLDFVLAMENRHEPQSLHYLFRILDIDGKGYLDTFCLNYFFRAIQELMVRHQQEPVSFEDVKDEIFDMVKPRDPCRITLKELIACGQGGTIVSILVDLNGFWTYENREAMVAESSGDAAV